MKENTFKTLELNVETIAQLTEKDLQGIVGGSGFHISTYCDTSIGSCSHDTTFVQGSSPC